MYKYISPIIIQFFKVNIFFPLKFTQPKDNYFPKITILSVFNFRDAVTSRLVVEVTWTHNFCSPIMQPILIFGKQSHQY